jgi:micrococcal nuclease
LAQVEQVVSGQTLTVRYVNGKTQERVRLLGVDAPDLQQHPWGANAQQVLAQAIASKTVLLEADVERGDRFGRRLVYLWQDGRLWNEQLVAAGYALAVSRSPNTKYEQRLARAQERARILGLGIWNPQLPMRQTPAEFRKLSRVRQP